MWQKIGLALVLRLVETFSVYAATTPDPLDDVIAAAITGLLEKLKSATNKSEVLAACDFAKNCAADLSE